MPNNKDELAIQQKRNDDLIKELSELEQVLNQKKAENEKVKEKLSQHKRQFDFIQTKLQKLANLKKRFIKTIRATAAYMLGRRNVKQLYSKSFKRKKAADELKKFNYHLYNLGFTEKALADLEHLFMETNNIYLKRAIAWELALWHANKYTQQGAYQALEYIEIAINGEQDGDQLRRASIIKAECHERLNEIGEGKRIIQNMLTEQKHPDLFLAAANLEKSVEERVKWINKALDVYGIQPIAFSSETDAAEYDDLCTQPLDKKIEDGPKVTVILPAYNSELGIRTAIESILSQTWRNIELLVVDDCSTDETVKVVKEYIQRDSRIALFTTPINSGPYVARNIALKEATGEFVTINDADDWSHAEKIERQVKHLLEHKEVIANTSEHSRLTEELKLYRRGTPGRYIFSNMSSLMFRRELVMKELGFWDSVRFAADGEFKRRLINVFGKERIVDLKTGPLSLPRQSVTSLTGNSAFGYNGFFMGVRKEYVESFEYFHNNADTLYYPFPQEKRLFPVPEPMWPNREDKPKGSRYFDVVIVSDFRLDHDLNLLIKEINVHKQMGLRTGLIQMASYNLDIRKDINSKIRGLIDGIDVQMLVYGEKVTCDALIVKHPSILVEKQEYIPKVMAGSVFVVIDRPPKLMNYEIRHCAQQLIAYFGKKGKWYPLSSRIRETLMEYHAKELQSINLSREDWISDTGMDPEVYASRLDDWFVDDNPYIPG